MSGITGIVDWDGTPVQREWMAAMIRAASHRGPDGSSVRLKTNAGFGYLAHHVTPESIGETQPLLHEPTGVVLAADVRLDNREELLRQVERQDESGDAALVLGAYLKWGEEFVRRLLGDFAIAIHDPRRRRVLLARDPMAMRPLYFADSPGRVLFASEIKQILAAQGVDRSINRAAVASHLGRKRPEAGTTFYHGISEVEPGCIMTICRETTHRRRYWDIDPRARLRYRTDEQYAEHFRELFLDSVARRLRSARPIGISLSGGMDSGSVASAVGWLYEHGRTRYSPEFRAYTWAFDSFPQCDERAVSRLITNRYGIPATDIPTGSAYPLKDYPDHGPDEDSPFIGHYQALIEATVSAAARDGAGVLFSGDRGDLMAGGNVFDLPGLLRAGRFGAMAREIRILRGDAQIPPHGIAWHYLTRPIAARALAAVRPRPDRSPVQAIRTRNHHVFAELHMAGMVWSDRTNARGGVGFADPWSDRRIAEFVLSVPQHILHTLSEPKRLVRMAMRGIMPESAIAGAQKVTPAPLYMKAIHEWARPTVESLARDMVAARMGFVDEQRFGQTVSRAFESGSNGFELWATLTLEMWLRRYWR